MPRVTIEPVTPKSDPLVPTVSWDQIVAGPSNPNRSGFGLFAQYDPSKPNYLDPDRIILRESDCFAYFHKGNLIITQNPCDGRPLLCPYGSIMDVRYVRVPSHLKLSILP